MLMLLNIALCCLYGLNTKLCDSDTLSIKSYTPYTITNYINNYYFIYKMFISVPHSQARI